MKTITLDGITWELPYHDLLPPLSSVQFEELKEDIRDKGANIYPVLWDGPFGNTPSRIRRVIDGGHRLRAIAELRAEGWTGELSEQRLSFASDEEEKQCALDLNIKRRQLSAEEKQAAVLKLAEQGKSIRAIAKETGVPKSTVADLLGSGVRTGQVTGSDGKTYPAQRPVSSPAGEHAATEELTPEEKMIVADAVARVHAKVAALEAKATKKDLTPEHRAQIAESVEAAFAKAGPLHPTTLLPSEPSQTPASPVAAEIDEGQEVVVFDGEREYRAGSCSICGKPAQRIKRGPLPYCDTHENMYGHEYRSCSSAANGCARWAIPAENCAKHGGADYTPRTNEEPTEFEKKTGPLMAQLIREEREKKGAHVGNNTGDQEWYTPSEYIEAARAVMGAIDLDPASCETANQVVKAARYYTKDDDGPAQEWRGRVWMNPPYAAVPIARFAKRLREEFEAGRVLSAVVLVNNATETKWFADLISCASAVCFPSSRVHFWHPDKDDASPLQGQAILYLGDAAPRFAEQFAAFGWVATGIKQRGQQ